MVPGITLTIGGAIGITGSGPRITIDIRSGAGLSGGVIPRISIILKFTLPARNLTSVDEGHAVALFRRTIILSTVEGCVSVTIRSASGAAASRIIAAITRNRRKITTIYARHILSQVCFTSATPSTDTGIVIIRNITATTSTRGGVTIGGGTPNPIGAGFVSIPSGAFFVAICTLVHARTIIINTCGGAGGAKLPNGVPIFATSSALTIGIFITNTAVADVVNTTAAVAMITVVTIRI
jgi:hypothetical protein